MIPDGISWHDLDRDARGRLRGLTKENAERVGEHLVMVGRLLDDDPERAYLHAQAAVRRAGRIDVVREAAALAAYRTERYAEALREFRTVRRLNGSSEHLPMMADCERGMGRPERALDLAVSEEASTLSRAAAVELGVVTSGARLDLKEPEAALSVLDSLGQVPQVLRERVAYARAAALEALGRPGDAAATLAPYVEDDDDVVVFDLEAEEPLTRSESGDDA
ncbi:hypothetical protein SAMN04489860_1913 [Paraoerskovia marina]|uniref:Tetratricopeptide repeat-containing protein n=1 Tax=Paraoerskovia marina TaxID=545619 RepID=A0A1H1TJ45_9CELL|nr:hypothetical protein [Paraoerskovia marina]SDS60091.1 hypothetical protein SAMN04489860_1913 [Paraoerskovia marina]